MPFVRRCSISTLCLRDRIIQESTKWESCCRPKLFHVCVPCRVLHQETADTYVDGALLGSPMELVGGMAGREGRTELRKATGFWMRLVGETGVGDTQRGWNWFPLEMENVSGGCAGSVGPGAGGSVWTETAPRGLVCMRGWKAKRFSLLTVLWMVWGVLLRVNTGELEGDTAAAVVFVAGKKCFGRVKLNVCEEGDFTCLLDVVTAGGAVEFKTLMLKGNSFGDEGDEFCNCCCSSKTWLWSCWSWLESLYNKTRVGSEQGNHHHLLIKKTQSELPEIS